MTESNITTNRNFNVRDLKSKTNKKYKFRSKAEVTHRCVYRWHEQLGVTCMNLLYKNWKYN